MYVYDTDKVEERLAQGMVLSQKEHTAKAEKAIVDVDKIVG